jgi:DDE superfamily endonuclease
LSDLQAVINQYPPEDVFNCDETGLFFKESTDRTFAFSSHDLKGIKKDKSRITILLCTNTTGTKKLYPFVIGKHKKPRCLKNVNIAGLGVHYNANLSSWMTRDLFEGWANRFDRSLSNPTLLIMDNASVHTINTNGFRFLKIIFIPPNTTSIAQPLDMGIIKSFKDNYKRYLLQHKVHKSTIITNDLEIIQGTEESVNLLDALKLLSYSWSKVSQETIANSFNYSPLFKSLDNLEPLSDVAIQISAFESQYTRESIPIGVDEAIALFIEESAESIEGPESSGQVEEVIIDENVTSEEPISLFEGLMLFEKVQKFMEQQGNRIGATIHTLFDVDAMILNIKQAIITSKNQSKITSFFLKH